MLRSVQRQLSGRDAQQLPGSYNASPRKRWNPFPQANDGSAASIHTAPSVKEAWRRAPAETKITVVALVGSILMIIFGWRALRYSSAGVDLSCHSQTCELKIRPVGWKKGVTITEISKHQIQPAVAVKVTARGDFVTDKDVELTEKYDPEARKKKKKTNAKQKSTYKGPDADGNYVSYAIVLSDVAETKLPDAAPNEDPPPPAVSLAKILPLMEAFTDAESGNRHYRVIPRKYGVTHSKRRVRTMVQKIQSYIRRRRLKMVIHEDAPPSWQGVLLMVFGFTIFLITIILGQCNEPTEYSGPGVRRKQTIDKPRTGVYDTLRTQTPSRYEVSTKPSSAKSTYRRGGTTAAAARKKY